MEANEVFSTQLASYKLIYDKALAQMKQGLNKVDKLSDYNGLTKIKFDSNIDKKKKEFHDLEMQIFNIKQNSVDNQNRLEELGKLIEQANAAVAEQDRRNYHSYNDNMNLK